MRSFGLSDRRARRRTGIGGRRALRGGSREGGSSRGEDDGAISDASGAEGSLPLTRTRQFWVLLGYAAALGVVGALASLVFMGVIGFGGNWYVVASPGWFGGQWWWIAVTTAAGVVVGLLRRATRLPEHTLV